MHDNMTGVEQEPTSLEHVRRSDIFPKKMLVSEDDKLRVPFPLLSGECAEFLGRTADGIVALSNFRVLIRHKESFINVPIGLIEGVELRDIFYIHVYCKDATVIRCAFSTNETCQDWYKRLLAKTVPCHKVEETFAFAFYAWCLDKGPASEPLLTPTAPTPDNCQQLCAGRPSCYNFTKEVERMEFDLSSAWRYTEINKNFTLCSSYPSEHIVPKSVKDENLTKVAGFRALKRFPSVVWRNYRNGAVLVRSSQPEIGVFGWRNQDDENLLGAIPAACAANPGLANRPKLREDSSGSDISSEDSSTVETGLDSLEEPKKMLIIDCRSYPAALANRAKGGGVECIDYYQSCEIQFMNLANIHAIRKSFVALRLLCSSSSDQASWLSGLETTKWLQNMSSLIKAAGLVVNVNEKEGRPVLVHCSDGWDRTPQIVSLSELMLDPYYRTVQGFQVLVEREWLQFGHKFADRCGNGGQSDDANERCPVFLQWLECVYQLLQQFPCEFEFNEAYLIKLVHHTYSCLFGTFLCNTLEERCRQQLEARTASVWNLLTDNAKFVNHLYAPADEHEVLYPAANIQNLKLWTSLYLSTNSSFAGPEDASTQQQVPPLDTPDSAGLQKTRSCENLLTMNDSAPGLGRRRSDPNITTDHGEQQTQKLLKDAMSGDTSCSSESVKSSGNNSSVSEGGELSMSNGVDGSPCKDEVKNGEAKVQETNGVVENGRKDEEEDVGENGNAKLENGNAKLENGNAKLENGNAKLENDTDKVESDNDKEDNVTDSEEKSDCSEENGKDSEASSTEEEGEGEGKEEEEKKELTLTNGHAEVNGKVEMNGHTEEVVNGVCDSNGVNGENGVDSSDETNEEVKADVEVNGADVEREESVEGLVNGSGNHEMNGHIEVVDQLNGQEDSSGDSGDNSIETISENEDSVGDRDSFDHTVSCNGENVGRSISKMCISEQNGTVESDTINQVVAIKLRQRLANDISAPSLESSTDTVTEEFQNGDSNHTLTPSPNNGPIYKVASLQSLCDKKFSSNKLKTVDQTTSISTSTSDLTDSRVLHNGSMNGFPREALLNVGVGGDQVQASLKLRCMLSQTGLCNGSSNGASTFRGVQGLNTPLTPPLYQTPVSPLSRNSTCPPTPATSDGKSIDSQVPRHQGGVRKHLDVDGLTKFTDPVQRQIEAIQARYDRDVARLKDEVSYLRGILDHAQVCNGDGPCGMDTKVDSPGQCDMGSMHSNHSTAASSDASWDPMDDPEVNITRWIPDHLVTQCAACETAFTVWNRKHHCRNCGKIFCNACCKDTAPLPHQMIHSAERVCRACYRLVAATLDRSIIVIDASEQTAPTTPTQPPMFLAAPTAASN